MIETKQRQGGCLCGAVTFTAKRSADTVSACHCTMCRKWGGGPFMEIDCGTGVEFTGAENISIFNSSDWAERGFCSRCGTHLFYRLKEGQRHMMPVGLFEGGEDLSFTKQVFIDEKPTYYKFSNDTKEMTGEELFASFASPE